MMINQTLLASLAISSNLTTKPGFCIVPFYGSPIASNFTSRAQNILLMSDGAACSGSGRWHSPKPSGGHKASLNMETLILSVRC